MNVVVHDPVSGRATSARWSDTSPLAVAADTDVGVPSVQAVSEMASRQMEAMGARM